jgi:predicted transcriptional regulator
MRRITVELDDRAVERLRAAAQRERREPRQQASWLLEQALLQLQQRTEPERKR